MNLLVDQGNTAVKLGIFNNDALVSKAVFLNDEFGFAQQWLQANVQTPADVLLCSVVEKEFELAAIPAISFLRLDAATKLPIKNNYATPETLGKDRPANAVAAWSLNPKKHSLCIDLGTCIKYDLVTADGTYQGGAISPGLEMRYKALHEYTDQLPLVETDVPSTLYGRDTQSSLVSGVKEGIINEINGFIARYLEEYKGLTIFMTGGDARFFDKAFKNAIFAQPDLTLIGLNEILRHNVQQK